jgi:hypothetical protein
MQKLDKVEFSLFIENKVVKNYLVTFLSMKGGEEEGKDRVFKNFMSNLYDSLTFAGKDLFLINNPGEKPKKGSNASIKKLSLIPLALLHCQGHNRDKVSNLFNLFSDENSENFENSKELRDFLFYLFILPTTCSLRSAKKTAESCPDKLEAISHEEYVKKTDAFEVKDIQRLREKFLLEFFLGSEKLTKDEYMSRFKEGGDKNFGWIFSASGIRHYLEISNDVKAHETSV